jgi:hypothetical protein
MPNAPVTTPTQIGQPALLVKPAPTFANYVAVEDTWKEKDNTVLTTTKDGFGETYNHTLSDPGVDATAELTIKAAATPFKKGDTRRQRTTIRTTAAAAAETTARETAATRTAAETR